MLRAVTAAAAFCAIALSQTPPASPTFEVASIKPAAPQEMGRMMAGMRGGPGTPDPGHFTATNASLKMLITNAFDVKGFQVTGPAWLDSQRFDIVAKVPQGATKEQFRQMLQNLLAERFKMVIHKETKEVPVYEMLEGKSGVKMKESPKETAAAADAPPPGGSVRDPGPPKLGKDGLPQLPPGAPKGAMMMMMGPKGARMQANHLTTGKLADMLSNNLGRPVLDKTGLTGEYDVTLDFSPEGLGLMRGMPMPPPGKGGPEGEHDGDTGPNLMTAVQEQLGLKLESRKGAVDLIVVDSMEKTPTEN